MLLVYSLFVLSALAARTPQDSDLSKNCATYHENEEGFLDNIYHLARFVASHPAAPPGFSESSNGDVHVDLGPNMRATLFPGRDADSDFDFDSIRNADNRIDLSQVLSIQGQTEGGPFQETFDPSMSSYQTVMGHFSDVFSRIQQFFQVSANWNEVIEYQEGPNAPREVSTQITPEVADLVLIYVLF